jgi:hypothetical protein
MPAMPSTLARYCTLAFSAPPSAVEFAAAKAETHVEGGVVQIAGPQPTIPTDFPIPTALYVVAA